MFKKVLIYNSGGGLGDAIQLFTLILSLKNQFKNCTFCYIGAHKNHFNEKLKEFNINLETVNLDLKYFGFRWWHLFRVKSKINEKKIDKFDLIIDLQSKLRNTLILRQIPCYNFFSSTYNFVFCTDKKNYLHKKQASQNLKNISTFVLLNLEIFLGIKIKKIDFSLEMLETKYIEEAKKLLPNSNYIGFSVTQGNQYREKTWPIDRFIKLAEKYISIDKKVVFFVEKENIELINYIKKNLPNSIFPEQESKISCPALVAALASRLEKVITIDNGVMHMLSLAKIPMITLFGPTNSEKFSPKRDNVKIIDSKILYYSNDIKKISVEDVFNISKII
jgi:ADP-heptose:LPS heptosyltransferase